MGKNDSFLLKEGVSEMSHENTTNLRRGVLSCQPAEQTRN